MKIINAMFGKKLGGIEQAFIDYSEALSIAGHEVLCLVRKDAAIIPDLKDLQQKFQTIDFKEIKIRSKWDILAKLELNRIIKNSNAKIAIGHGNRPVALMGKSCAVNKIPLVGVVHNYWFNDVLKSDALFCITDDIISKLRKDFNKNLFKVPNAIRIGAEPEFRMRQDVPVIGVIGRMVEKKGIGVFIKSLKILHENNVACKAIIGGDGELLEEMKELAEKLGLSGKIDFMGWVKDKQGFYNSIDIFCLPSLSEPFGIVLLEAMKEKKPIVATNIEGPAEILENGKDALLVEKNDEHALANALTELINDDGKCAFLAENGFRKAKEKFDIRVISGIINNHLKIIADGNG